MKSSPESQTKSLVQSFQKVTNIPAIGDYVTIIRNGKSALSVEELKMKRKKWRFWFGLVFLFNIISTFLGYLLPKPFLVILFNQ